MRYRYIDGLDWIDVAANMNYSWRHMHRIHSESVYPLWPDYPLSYPVNQNQQARRLFLLH